MQYYFNLNSWFCYFWSTGILGGTWFIFWALLIHDTPAKHPRISYEEKKYIETSIGPKKKVGYVGGGTCLCSCISSSYFFFNHVIRVVFWDQVMYVCVHTGCKNLQNYNQKKKKRKEGEFWSWSQLFGKNMREN